VAYQITPLPVTLSDLEGQCCRPKPFSNFRILGHIVRSGQAKKKAVGDDNKLNKAPKTMRLRRRVLHGGPQPQCLGEIPGPPSNSSTNSTRYLRYLYMWIWKRTWLI